MFAIGEIPRAEHPRPQFVRDDWINLNGAWSFAFDFGKSGHERGFAESSGFDRRIVVPFCPESGLSGVGHRDFIECMWYQRPVEVPAAWRGKRVLLHFGAVDFLSEVFLDGELVGRHWGGSSSFTLDVTRFVRPGATHSLVVHVRDEVRSGRQARGKQCPDFDSRGCLYTRTTGIWQTVWLEAVSPAALRQCHLLPDLDAGRFVLVPSYWSVRPGLTLRATLKDGDAVVAQASVAAADGAAAALDIEEPKPWSPGSPFLYDLLLEVLDGEQLLDSVRSYAGLRKVHLEGNRFFLNDEPIHLRLVLDQGFYPEGVWTAPSDEALRRDIELSMAAGFNGARLHQKVFEERFHYWADRLGYLTWGESASWGLAMWRSDADDDLAAASAWNFLAEWREVVLRDRNHPSIIAWTPFNETRGGAGRPLHSRLHVEAYELSRALDPTRPVNDSSGYVHVRTDLWTVHNYEQDPAKLAEKLTPDAEAGVFRNAPEVEAPYEGQPYIVDEFGGIKWVPPDRRPFSEISWGYGEGPKTLDEFYERLAALVGVVDGLEHACGWCYTQLTDVEQEQNGIYNYDRTEKFDMQRIRLIFRGDQER
ncbi:MAG: sugar-binding domain-containing protein [Phycisphaerae bacterium]